jgi:hypothetical protein
VDANHDVDTGIADNHTAGHFYTGTFHTYQYAVGAGLA